MPTTKILVLAAILAAGVLTLGGCSPIPDAPGPIGIPGI